MIILRTKIIPPSIRLNNGVGIAAVCLRHHSTALDAQNIQHEAAIEAENQPVAAAFLPHHSTALDAENIQHEAAIDAENQLVAAAFLSQHSTALDAENIQHVAAIEAKNQHVIPAFMEKEAAAAAFMKKKNAAAAAIMDKENAAVAALKMKDRNPEIVPDDEPTLDCVREEENASGFALDASKTTSNLSTHEDIIASPLDSGVDGATVGPTKYILTLPSKVKVIGKVRKLTSGSCIMGRGKVNMQATKNALDNYSMDIDDDLMNPNSSHDVPIIETLVMPTNDDTCAENDGVDKNPDFLQEGSFHSLEECHVSLSLILRWWRYSKAICDCDHRRDILQSCIWLVGLSSSLGLSYEPIPLRELVPSISSRVSSPKDDSSRQVLECEHS
ncbi:hypothetical protein ACH5RR_040871 [Cinchona calisaya]|uniref:Uncharacterized protein n=1 Tax=Cinchona calisaya TaxID=153742 RepID=A0ABD2XY06_9GENT